MILDGKENSFENMIEGFEFMFLIKLVSLWKGKKRVIFVLYVLGVSFIEKCFILYIIKELKNIGFCDDIWFDKDDGLFIESLFCF